MAHSQPAAHRGFPLIFMVRYLWPMGVYEGHFRKLERALPESINIADLYRRLQRITDGEGILRRALVAAPQDAGVHRALGLALVRLKRLDRGARRVRRASPLASHSAGRGSEAMATLKDSLAHHPDDRDTLLAVPCFSRDAGDPTTALEYAERLARIAPATQTFPRSSKISISRLKRTGAAVILEHMAASARPSPDVKANPDCCRSFVPAHS